MRDYLINKILDKYEKSRSDWNDKKEGGRSIKIQQAHYDEVQAMLHAGKYEGYASVSGEDFVTGKECILAEARWLEEKKLAVIKWLMRGNDIEIIQYSLEQIGEFYRIADRTPKFAVVNRDMEQLKVYHEQIQSEWIKQYYEERMARVQKGKGGLLEEWDEDLFRCLCAIEKLSFPMYVRCFSSRYLGDSKTFERKLKSKVLSIAKKYHPMVDDEMEEYQIYEQLFLDTYSQELSLKGELKICLDGKEIDLGMFTYGTVLNSETLKKAEIAKEQTITKVITVENKANYVSMPYEEGTLLIFSHGFFSPLEREFLKQLELVLEDDVEYLHTGDLDYGGICIFQYIRKTIFPKVKPYLMSVEQYNRYEKNAVPIKKETLEKLEKLKEPLLQDLIELLCEKQKGIEQETFIF